MAMIMAMPLCPSNIPARMMNTTATTTTQTGLARTIRTYA